METKRWDFSGWATKNDLRCSDGRVIRKDAFKDCDGHTVPLVWNHQHNDPNDILGHARLENREEGVYAYCSFNDSENAKSAKEAVKHGDVAAMSIFANQLKQQGSNVVHGAIREVSLVLAGANPGAFIDSVICHNYDTGYDEETDEAVISTGDKLELFHAEESKEEKKTSESNSEETVGDVFNTLTEKQKNVVYAIIGELMGDKDSDAEEDDNKEDDTVKHNVFDKDTEKQNDTLTHSEMSTIINDAKRYGSMKESFIQHAEEYGIENLEYLFPDARNITDKPTFIQREMGWVSKVMNGTHHSPFSRIKSIFADITEDEARAKGYIKGKLKKEEVFSLLKRTTTPCTIYKKQKMDRDDVIDITDFDVIAWLKQEMRMMLDEEIARAILVGDGRLASSDDKIKEDCIRPIFKDDGLYTIKASVTVASSATDSDKAKEFIRAAIKARKDYKGSGNPTLFTTEDILTDCLLLEDEIGHFLYSSPAQLANVLRVKEIVTVPVMEGVKDASDKPLMGVIVNLADYNVGADKGGAINMFDDFDIDYNQQKYLIETRCSGALVKPYSAIALTLNVSA